MTDDQYLQTFYSLWFMPSEIYYGQFTCFLFLSKEIWVDNNECYFAPYTENL